MKELPKAYEAKTVDEKWYKFWEEQGFFKADATSDKPVFSVMIPPPNVTGVLHMGHALVNTLQDVITRWKRMSGYNALWLPGTDHAGIATQTVVERKLLAATGKKRTDFSREEFLEHVWKWKNDNEANIINQLKRLGSSCDWSRQRFTLDEGNNRAVRAMFKKLFDAGLIYLGDYLVNWDPVTRTALADDEVEYQEEQSFLWTITYPLADGSGVARIATTRPETMLGDTAIAVSPRDPRYAHMIGKMANLPLSNREIPIIADHHVEPEFGTGMVKITPAHDPNDYQMGMDHNLPFINIMTPDGRINENGGKYQGLTMAEARKAVIEDLKAQGFLEKIEPHTLRVGVSYRSKARIEPYMSKQWFVKMESFAPKLKELVESKKVKLIPENWENTYYHWINNLRDWCISRQLWWGHRIPIWHKKDSDEMICYAGEGLPPEVEKNPDQWTQDPDVLDTWFSSALWPFATLGWPENTPDLQKFYPNSVLITGHDILFFWVARMLMMGEYAMGEAPFPETFLHGLIYGKSYWRNQPDGGIAYVSEAERRDYDLGKPQPKDVQGKWEKMSKSKGNVIDPLELIEEYGTDAVRMALCASATQAREIDLDRRRFEEFRNFANKVWNGSRFVFMNLEGLTSEDLSQGLDEKLLALEDRWILSALNRTVRDVNAKLKNYMFDQAALEAYEFFWKEFCAYYVEIVKPVLFGKKGSPEEKKNKQKILVVVLCQALRLMHPMAPFITEELFQLLKEQFPDVKASQELYTKEAIEALHSPSCMVAPYPQVLREADINPTINEAFALVEKVIYNIRNIRGEMKLPPSTSTEVYFCGPDLSIQAQENIISALIKTHGLHFVKEEPKLGFSSTGTVDNLKIIIPLPEEMIKQEQTRLGKEKEKLVIQIEKGRQQLNNPEFVSKAPPQLIAKHKEQLEKAEKELQEIEVKLK